MRAWQHRFGTSPPAQAGSSQPVRSHPGCCRRMVPPTGGHSLGRWRGSAAPARPERDRRVVRPDRQHRRCDRVANGSTSPGRDSSQPARQSLFIALVAVMTLVGLASRRWATAAAAVGAAVAPASGSWVRTSARCTRARPPTQTWASDRPDGLRPGGTSPRTNRDTKKMSRLTSDISLDG